MKIEAMDQKTEEGSKYVTETWKKTEATKAQRLPVADAAAWTM